MPTILETLSEIIADVRELADAVQARAEVEENLSARELSAIRKLIERSEKTLEMAEEEARRRRLEEIAGLEALIEHLDGALSVPGLSTSVRDDLRALRRSRRARLLRLQAREAMDFAGILSASEVKEIREVLARAKRDVARKKKADALLFTLLRMADLAMDVAAKLG